MQEAQEMLKRAHEKGLRYLIIGGWAGKHFGVQRETRDIDLLVEIDKKEDWRALVESRGYKLAHTYKEFLRFQALTDELPATDLMLVNGATFEKMHQRSEVLRAGDGKSRVPSITDLVALKLKGLRDQAYRRELGLAMGESHPHKTLRDIVELMRIKRGNLSSDRHVGLVPPRDDRY